MLRQHKYYVYHEENRVMARMDNLPPVVAEVCEQPIDKDGNVLKDEFDNDIYAAQLAHDKVQAIVNPAGRKADSFGPKGFHSPKFQDAISGNCGAAVREAYARAGMEVK